jgi:hypothetical protein
VRSLVVLGIGAVVAGCGHRSSSGAGTTAYPSGAQTIHRWHDTRSPAQVEDDEDVTEGGAAGATVVGAGMLHGYRFKSRDRRGPALTSVSLKDVHLDRAALAPGQRTEGLATFTPAPADDLQHYYLQAVSADSGHSWKLWIGDRRDGRATFWLGCSRRRPSSVVHWTFSLWHADGRRSNAVEVEVRCTGGAERAG